MRVDKTVEFESWYGFLTLKEKAQIDARLQRIGDYEHFGDLKELGVGLAELRWKNGRRIYFTRFIRSDGSVVLLLLGGRKSAQKKDIKQARLLIQKYAGEVS